MATVHRGIGRYLANSRDIDLEPELQAVAEDVLSNAIGLAAEHVDSSEYVRSLQIARDRTSPSGRDLLVYSDDPGAPDIEWGHLSGTGTSEQRRPVEGQHILGRAADAAGGTA